MEEIAVSRNGKYRLLIEPDYDAQCPRGDWSMVTGFAKMPNRGNWRLNDVPEVHESEIPVLDAYDRLGEDLAVRWAKVFHGVVLEWDSEHGGYWFCDPDEFRANWPDLKSGTPEHLASQGRVIEWERAAYRQWADGDVYGVVLEEILECAPIERDEDGSARLVDPLTDADIERTSRIVEAIWGNYFSDGYGPMQVALENFPSEIMDAFDR